MNNKYTDTVKYGSYISLSNANTKPFLMLSELIDNSISSFEREYGSNIDNWKEKLTINIKMHFPGERDRKHFEKESEFICISNWTIVVEDNGFGIDRDKLADCVKLDKIKVNENTKGKKSRMNVHGRGLKQAAFYYGYTLNVSTFNGIDSSEITIDATKNHRDDPIQFEVKRSLYKKRGTKIEISNLNEKNSSITFTKMLNIFEALASRYSGFLMHRQNFEIRFVNPQHCFTNSSKNKDNFVTELKQIWNDNKRKELESSFADIYESDIVLKEFRIRKWILNKENFKKSHLTNLPALKEKFKQRVYKERNEKGDKECKTISKWEYIDESSFWGTFHAIDRLIDDYNFYDTAKFEWSYKDPKKNWEFKFYKTGLSNKRIKWRGVFIKEGNRFLQHGPILEGEQTTYVEWERGTESGSTNNSFGGIFDITNFREILPQTDKSNMNISGEDKEHLNKIIYGAWAAFNCFELAFRGRTDTKNNSTIYSPAIIDDIQEKYSKDAKQNIILDNFVANDDDKSLAFDLHHNKSDLDKTWKVTLIESEVEDPSIILTTQSQIDNKNKEIILYFNMKSSILVNADKALKHEKLFKDFIIPFLVSFATFFINDSEHGKNWQIAEKINSNGNYL